MLKIGTEYSKTCTVTKENTAASVGSGDLPVYATPAMIALMEGTAAESVASQLDDGDTTVGSSLAVKHLSATPVGMTIRCESKLCEIDGKRLCFTVRAFDETGLIGEGTHERFIVNAARFLEKAASKREK